MTKRGACLLKPFDSAAQKKKSRLVTATARFCSVKTPFAESLHDQVDNPGNVNFTPALMSRRRDGCWRFEPTCRGGIRVVGRCRVEPIACEMRCLVGFCDVRIERDATAACRQMLAEVAASRPLAESCTRSPTSRTVDRLDHRTNDRRRHHGNAWLRPSFIALLLRIAT